MLMRLLKAECSHSLPQFHIWMHLKIHSTDLENIKMLNEVGTRQSFLTGKSVVVFIVSTVAYRMSSVLPQLQLLEIKHA